MAELRLMGWNERWESKWKDCESDGWAAARVIAEQKNLFRIGGEFGEHWAEPAGRLRYRAAARDQWPAVGDWVAVDARPWEGRARIHRVLPRTSKFSRKAAGRKVAEQVLAANVDTAFLVTSLNRDLNPRRIERYLALVWESGASPVVLLTKADLCHDRGLPRAEVERAALGVPVLELSAVTGEGLDALAARLAPGRTAVLLGSSGVGKSTLVNRLLGHELLRVQPVRSGDGRGRHTTTVRQLIVLPGGALLIDTPGLRELSLWESEAGLDHAFGDIAALAADCRFTDCRHENEPGCAVQRAIAAGACDPTLLQSYRKLQRELAYLDRRNEAALESAEEKKWRTVHKEQKRLYRERGRI